MAFLDNSGDIILDAVLTDTGRYRLAKGDGTFKIAKFVFADDEINYGLYDKNNASGSAYYDLDILQTPIFEAFTNNTSVVKYPLLSISKTNLLYLPVMKLNVSKSADSSNPDGTALYSNYGLYCVTTDTDTNTYLTGDGVLNGISTTYTSIVRIDQGIDNTALTPTPGDSGNDIDSFLKETQYIVEIDNRLGLIYDKNGKKQTPAFIDDDNIASYYFTLTDSSLVTQIITATSDTGDISTGQVIAGVRGTCLGIVVKSTNELAYNTYLFTTLGSISTLGTSNSYYYIDTNIVVKGVTTGSSINIPIRFVKYKTP